jgi:DNA-binding GntR family transcriptional regulator
MRSDTTPAVDAAAGAPSAAHGNGAGFLASVAGAVPSRTVVVLDAIRHAILTGRLRPGQAMVETDLAGMLGVSKTPVREALKTLAGAGLVTMSPYKGATVRTVDDDLVRSVYDLRLLLEPEAVRRAVTRDNVTATAQGGADAAWRALERSALATDRADRSLANRDFHRALYLDCGNALLVQVLDDLRDQTALVSAAAWQHAPTWQAEAAEHEAILRAATAGDAGDADAASALLTAHIQNFLARNFPTLADTAHAGETYAS